MGIKAKKTLIWSIPAVIIIVAIAVFTRSKPATQPAMPITANLDAFAQCISNSGAKLYGAFWCTHCKSQKELFGDSQKLLPYVECSTPTATGQTQICKDKNIEGYPTWIFADGSTQSGELSLDTLAAKTGCSLPQ